MIAVGILWRATMNRGIIYGYTSWVVQRELERRLDRLRMSRRSELSRSVVRKSLASP